MTPCKCGCSIFTIPVVIETVDVVTVNEQGYVMSAREGHATKRYWPTPIIWTCTTCDAKRQEAQTEQLTTTQ